jgi:protein-disulfide isomerase
VASAVAAGAQAPAEQAPPPLAIQSATPDRAAGTLTVTGAHFGPRPFVTLELVPLTLRSATESEILAAVPIGMMPPGRYLLTVSRGPGEGETASVRVELAGAPGDGPPDATTPAGAAAAPTPERPGPGAMPSGTDTAAQVGDRAITIDDVDREWQRTEPAGYLAASRRVYEARRRAVQTLVNDELLAREASERGVAVEALLAAEVPKRAVPMPDVAVVSLYQALGDRARGATLEQMTPAIRAWLARVTEPEVARMNFIEELMKVSTRAEILLRAPRVDIARAEHEASLGPLSAPVEIVVFADVESPDYARFGRTFARVRDTFGNRLRIVYKPLPLRGLLSETAARAAECARRQGRFWEFHDAVVTSPGFLDTLRLKRIAGEAGLARAAFDACLDGDEARSVVAEAQAEAARYAVTTSPAFMVNGALAPAPPPFLPPFEYLQRLVEEELARLAKQKPGR